MGLFVTENGRYQGWLATLLCCCAAVNEDEAPFERERDRTNEDKNEATHSNVYSQQPMPLTTLPTTIHPAHQPLRDAGVPMAIDGSDISARTNTTTPTPSERPPSLAPIDCGATFVSNPRRNYDRRSSSADSNKRPRSRPTLVHRASDNTIDKRQALVPMRLGPVVLRNAPSNFSEDAHTLSIANEPTQTRLSSIADTPGSFATPDLTDAHDHLIYGQRLTQPSKALHATNFTPLAHHHHALASSSDRPTASRASLSDRSCASSIRKHSSTSSLGSKNSFERVRPGRMRSFPTLRRHTEDLETQLDNEILELNTIVEERRTEANRTSTVDKHIPAIAPSMHIMARSETLDAIGSALSRPRTMRGTLSTDICAGATSPVSFSYNTRHNRSRTWVSGWLSNMLPTSSSSPSPSSTVSPSSQISADDPFYEAKATLHARELSHDSSNPSMLVPASPTLTTVSSPTTTTTTTTKGRHSRSQTSESHTLSLATVYSYASDDKTTQFTAGCGSGYNGLYNSGFGITPVAGQIGVAI